MAAPAAGTPRGPWSRCGRGVAGQGCPAGNPPGAAVAAVACSLAQARPWLPCLLPARGEGFETCVCAGTPAHLPQALRSSSSPDEMERDRYSPLQAGLTHASFRDATALNESLSGGARRGPSGMLRCRAADGATCVAGTGGNLPVVRACTGTYPPWGKDGLVDVRPDRHTSLQQTWPHRARSSPISACQGDPPDIAPRPGPASATPDASPKPAPQTAPRPRPLNPALRAGPSPRRTCCRCRGNTATCTRMPAARSGWGAGCGRACRACSMPVPKPRSVDGTAVCAGELQRLCCGGPWGLKGWGGECLKIQERDLGLAAGLSSCGGCVATWGNRGKPWRACHACPCRARNP